MGAKLMADMACTSEALRQHLDDVGRLVRGGQPLPGVAAAEALAAAVQAAAPAGAPGEWRALVIDTAILLARALRRASRFDAALRAIRPAIEAAQAGGDRRREVVARAQHSHVLSCVGDCDHALAESYAALQLASRIGDPATEAIAHEALGDVHWAMQQWDAGAAAYARTLALAKACGDLDLCALGHAGLGAMAHGRGLEAEQAGDAQQALTCRRLSALHAAEFTRFAERSGDAHNAATGRHNEAVALIALGEWARARERIGAMLAGLGPEPSATRVVALKNLADIDINQGELGAGIERMRAALAMADELNMPSYAHDCCRELSDVCERVGDLAAALAYHRRYHALYVQIASQSAQNHAQALAVVYETEKVRADADAERRRADTLQTSNAVLSITAERLARASLEDALTGIANRRRFDQLLHDELPARPAVQPYSLAVLDIDHFKVVNDRFSHAAGDAVLRHVGAVLAANCRRDDLAARYGGEEFVLLLGEVEPPAALLACERVRRAIAEVDWASVHPGLTEVTVSIGLAHRGEPGAPADPARLLALADERLYAAKNRGRNRVIDGGQSM